jgi:dihydrofolate reductase
LTRKIIFSAAMSLDGFIADLDDGFDWIKGDDHHDLDTLEHWDYPAFLSTIDTVIMGRRCYELGQHKDFIGQRLIVASSHPIQDPVVVFTQDAVQTINTLKETEGKDVFVFGGATLTQSLIKADVIDHYIIGIVPIILGKGIRLFNESDLIQLHLVKQTIEEGIVILHYEKRLV